MAKTARLYYLHMDGKTITTSHPASRVKGSIVATNKAMATKGFEARFIKNPDGTFGRRMPGGQGDTRRVTVRPAGQAAPMGTPMTTSMGGTAISGRVQAVARAEANEETPGELAEEITTALEVQQAQAPTWTEFKVGEVTFRMSAGSLVCVGPLGILLIPPPKEPIVPATDPIGELLVVGKA